MEQEEAMRVAQDELQALVGSVVTSCGVIEFMMMLATSYAEHPGDTAKQEQRITQLYGRRGPEIAKICESSLAVSSVPNESLREKLRSICAWYVDTYEQRNRLIHDAWMFRLEGNEYKLARIVTAKKTPDPKSVPEVADLDALRTLRNDIASAHLVTIGYTSKLRGLAGGNPLHPEFL